VVELRAMLEKLRPEQGIEWQEDGAEIMIRMKIASRSQRIRVRKEGSEFVFSTGVHAPDAMDGGAEHRRRLAIRAWTRNSKTELVNFMLDEADHLVGEIRHPADHLDAEELAIYLRVLGSDGDRFEYVLTGKDKH